MNPQIRREIRKLYAFGFFWMFLPIIPVLVAYQLQLGLSMQQVFLVQVFFGLVCAAFEVPSGYVCDLFGRKGTLIGGAVLWGIGFSLLYFVKDFTGMLIYEGILGVSVSLVSGADVSMLYDWLKLEEGPGAGERESATKVLANYQMFQVGSEAIAGALCGLLVSLSYQHVLFGQLLTGWLPLVAVLFLREPPYDKLSRHSHLDNFRIVWKHVFVEDKLLKLIVLNQIVWSLATFVAVWIYQKLWQGAGIPLVVFGLLWAGYNLVVGITGQQVQRLEKRYGSAVLLVILAVLPILGYAGLALASGWAIVAVGLLFQFSRGITQIILKDAINWRTPGSIRATVLSLMSLLFRVGFAILGPLTGWAIDHLGLSQTLWLLAAVFGLAYALVMLPLLKEVRLIKAVPQA
ncbi:MAG: MFS transporter [Candidatus Sericytochromatia bacterium]